MADERKIPPDGPSVYEERNPPPHDSWARQSFTFRRMSKRDIWIFSIALAVLAVLAAMWIAA
jgi:hypothetical protein